MPVEISASVKAQTVPTLEGGGDPGGPPENNFIEFVEGGTLEFVEGGNIEFVES